MGNWTAELSPAMTEELLRNRAGEAQNALAGNVAPWAPNEGGRLAPEGALAFILAGNATFTTVSRRTGVRFTYRVREAHDPAYLANKARGAETVHFVSVLTGSDNESSYSYLGTIFGGNTYRHGRKSRISLDALSAQAFAWLFDRLFGNPGPLGPEDSWSELSEAVDIYHEGRCGRCGRKLTVPESITTGFGPECAGVLGVRS